MTTPTSSQLPCGSAPTHSVQARKPNVTTSIEAVCDNLHVAGPVDGQGNAPPGTPEGCAVATVELVDQLTGRRLPVPTVRTAVTNVQIRSKEEAATSNRRLLACRHAYVACCRLYQIQPGSRSHYCPLPLHASAWRLTVSHLMHTCACMPPTLPSLNVELLTYALLTRFHPPPQPVTMVRWPPPPMSWQALLALQSTQTLRIRCAGMNSSLLVL